MSIVLVVFNGAPSPSVDALQRELQLDRTLERRVKGGTLGHSFKSLLTPCHKSQEAL